MNIMSIKTLNWRIQQSNSASLARSFLLAGTVTSIICIILITSKKYEVYILWLLATVVLFSVSLPIAFAKKYLNYKKSEHFITLSSESLTIPTPMMNNRTIYLKKIKSFETLDNQKRTTGIIIGLSNGSSELVDARAFESQSAFEDFTQKLINYTTQDSSKISNDNTGTPWVECIKNNDKTMRLVVFSIFATYATTTSSGLKEITDKAIEIGALTKTTLQLPELYRFASSFFLHFDANHFLINILCIIFIGRNIDIILGKLRFSGILFGSALAGSLLSLNYSASNYVIGASGGIMGLLGAYAVICLRYQHCIPGSVSTSANRIFFVLFLQVTSDLTIPGVDVFSHVGGLLFGVTHAIFFLHERQPKNISSYSPAEAIITGTIGSFYLIGLIYFLATYL